MKKFLYPCKGLLNQQSHEPSGRAGELSAYEVLEQRCGPCITLPANSLAC